MIFGMTTFTLIHVLLSLIGIFTGLIVMAGLLNSRKQAAWTFVFLATTAAASVTGFGFAFDHLLPSHIVGIISLVILTLAILALYAFRLQRAWRWVYVICAVFALYLNVFVLVAQAFLKVAALHALAPTQAEPPFAIAQGIVLLIFLVIGALAAKKFRPVSIS